MPRNPNPIRPRKKDARDLEAALRKAFLLPFYADARRSLAMAASAAEAYGIMDDVVERILASPRVGLSQAEIQRFMNRMNGWHRKRVLASFRAAIGVNIRPVLSETPVAFFMTKRIGDSVDLIKTIPPRFHADLKTKMEAALRSQPFDQRLLAKVVSATGQSSGYNLRRIVRDQTSKAINGLSEIRQRQAGVSKYQWLTSQDQRVRPTHVANNGMTFDWGAPPAATGHPGDDVNCRCVPIAVVTQEMANRLKSAAAHSSTGIDVI